MSIEYKCKDCIKSYSTYKSLWRHIKTKHKSSDVSNVSPDVSNVSHTHNFNCAICNKIFNSRTTKWRHQRKCTDTKKDIDDKSKDDIILEMKKDMDKMKEMLQQALKIHPKTLTKINKQLNNTNNGVINNNNFNIVQLGNENLSDVLTNKQKMYILNRQVMGLNDLIDLVHISGKYKKFMPSKYNSL